MTWRHESAAENQTHEMAFGIFLTNSMLILAISMMTMIEWYILNPYPILLVFILYIVLISLVNSYEPLKLSESPNTSEDDDLESDKDDLDLSTGNKIDHYIFFQTRFLILNFILFISILVSQVNQFAILGLYPVLLLLSQLVVHYLTKLDLDIEQLILKLIYSTIIFAFIFEYQPWYNFDYISWVMTNLFLAIGIVLFYSYPISISEEKKNKLALL